MQKTQANDLDEMWKLSNTTTPLTALQELQPLGAKRTPTEASGGDPPPPAPPPPYILYFLARPKNGQAFCT